MPNNTWVCFVVLLFASPSIFIFVFHVLRSSPPSSSPPLLSPTTTTQIATTMAAAALVAVAAALVATGVPGAGAASSVRRELVMNSAVAHCIPHKSLPINKAFTKMFNMVYVPGTGTAGIMYDVVSPTHVHCAPPSHTTPTCSDSEGLAVGSKAASLVLGGEEATGLYHIPKLLTAKDKLLVIDLATDLVPTGHAQLHDGAAQRARDFMKRVTEPHLIVVHGLASLTAANITHLNLVNMLADNHVPALPTTSGSVRVGRSLLFFTFDVSAAPVAGDVADALVNGTDALRTLGAHWAALDAARVADVEAAGGVPRREVTAAAIVGRVQQVLSLGTAASEGDAGSKWMELAENNDRCSGIHTSVDAAEGTDGWLVTAISGVIGLVTAVLIGAKLLSGQKHAAAAAAPPASVATAPVAPAPVVPAPAAPAPAAPAPAPAAPARRGTTPTPAKPGRSRVRAGSGAEGKAKVADDAASASATDDEAAEGATTPPHATEAHAEATSAVRRRRASGAHAAAAI